MLNGVWNAAYTAVSYLPITICCLFVFYSFVYKYTEEEDVNIPEGGKFWIATFVS